MNNQIVAAIRTAAAAATTFLALVLIESFAEIGIVLELGPNFESAFSLALFGVLTGLYNFAINWLAERFPWVGYLLVVNKTPEYPNEF